MFRTREDVVGLKRYLSPVGAWALAFGCSVGWGAFVMPGTTFLPIAGPLGTVLGMVIGGCIMLLIGVCYHYLMNKYPECGGTFTFSKEEAGYDHGFLSAWFLGLVYIAIIWANATAIPLICGKLLGNTLKTGPHYTVAGFEIYISEALLALAAILIAGLICMIGGRFASIVQTVFAVILIGGVLLSFLMILSLGGPELTTIRPSFSSDGDVPIQVIRIIVLAPWAFVGFESISHSTEEFRFDCRKSVWILVAALVTGVLAYSLLTVIAVTDLPKGASDWTEYIANLSEKSGVDSIPVFHSIYAYLGKGGVYLLGLTTVAGIMTGLIGNMIAASRLIYSMARERVLPKAMEGLSSRHVPVNAILLVTILSVPISFLGRTAIGWIVDVNTIGATIAYLYTTWAAYHAAKREGNRKIEVIGLIGLAISVFFTLYFLIPNFWSVEELGSASYFILIIWCILGFVMFQMVLRKDRKGRFGKTTIAWLALLFFVFFLTMLWYREASKDVSEQVLEDLYEHHIEEMADYGLEYSAVHRNRTETFLQDRMNQIEVRMQGNSFIQMAIIMTALFIMFRIYNTMLKRHSDMELQKVRAEESNRAKSTFLSNMSHDLRTPMNAILGYTEIAQKLDDLPEQGKTYLEKIDASGKQLLALINDILDMSHIESGKMDLDPEQTDLIKVMEDVRDMFTMQMEMKELSFTVDTSGVKNRYALCDGHRLNRVLMNLISNAYKYTPSGGKVTATLNQTGEEKGIGFYEIRVKDTGMGMSPEFAATVFDAYTRESSAKEIQGTGLGMAITKSIVELMGGSISVISEKGKGTEFVILVDFELTDPPAKASQTEEEESVGPDFAGVHILLAEDQVVNREIASIILQEFGFTLDYAENGREAVEKVEAAPAGTYKVILMDIQMPEMDGYEAAAAIRALPDPEKNHIPIVAMTANAFAEDIQHAKDVGMNAHVSKPIEVPVLLNTLQGILRN